MCMMPLPTRQNLAGSHTSPVWMMADRSTEVAKLAQPEASDVFRSPVARHRFGNLDKAFTGISWRKR